VLLPSSSAEPARWLIEEVRGPRGRVSHLLPARFEAYVAVFHPAWQWTLSGTKRHDERPVSWATVAAANQRRYSAQMQWPGVTGSFRYLDQESQPETWKAPPERGTMPAEVSAELMALLSSTEASSEQWWFGVWQGYREVAPPFVSGSGFRLPDRDYWLMHGEPHDSLEPVFGPPDRQLANLWWPPSQDWLVVTDIDLDRTYIAGSCSLADELLSHPLLESLPVSLEDPLAWNSDPYNCL